MVSKPSLVTRPKLPVVSIRLLICPLVIGLLLQHQPVLLSGLLIWHLAFRPLAT